MTTPTVEVLEFSPVELPSHYAKAIVAILTAVATVLVAALTDGVLTQVEVINAAIALLTAVGVYLVPNLPEGVGRYAKAGVAVVGTVLQAVAGVLAVGSFTPQGVMIVLVAALGALSVGIVPNAGYAPQRVAADGEVL